MRLDNAFVLIDGHPENLNLNPALICRNGEILGRQVAGRVAVGEGERGQPLRMAGGEDLGDGPAGVVGDEIDTGEPERVAEVLQPFRQCGDRQVLAGGYRAAAVQGEVKGDAAPSAGALPGQRADDIAPEVGVSLDSRETVPSL